MTALRLCRICLALALALALTGGAIGPSPARAESEDGGTRSVFAYGAGTRALALGGAYAALADDASAPLWNPGGLGRVVRPEFQGSHTSLYGLGINEQYASLVLPSWRWGVGSVTLRRFAVDGIEQRDDRNVLVAGDLSDSEIELAFGYGRPLGELWSVGGTVKVQRQSLAGFSGSGAGVDLGVVGHPLVHLFPHSSAARRFTLGLAVRNIVEPQIKLLSENVPDPTGVRLGTAFAIPVFRGQVVTAALDLEKTSGAGMRVHSGVEVQVHPLLTLRAGVNDGRFAIGSGIEWQGVSLDYAFEDNTIETVHRVGATFAFGPTVDERRLAAREAREKALQDELARAFRAKQQERIAALTSDAAAARTEGDFEEALRILAVVSALDPGNDQVRRTKALCLNDLAASQESAGDYVAASLSYSRALAEAPGDSTATAGYDRCRRISDRMARRSVELRERFAAALDDFSNDNLLSARRGFAAILEMAPEDEDAAKMLRRTLKRIDNRVADLLSQADQLIAWGRLDEAGLRLNAARALNAKSAAVDRVAMRLGRARAQVAAATVIEEPDTPADEPDQPELTEEQRQEVDRLYNRALQAVENGRPEDAIKYWELVWSLDPSYPGVAAHLKREYLTRGMEFFADGRLEDAVRLWESALRVDPGDERARGYIQRAREQMVRTREILGQNE